VSRRSSVSSLPRQTTHERIGPWKRSPGQSPELPKVLEKGDAQFQNAMIELAVLTVMTLSLVFCLVLLRKRHPDAVAERV
jgi:hypothetical protein